MRFANANHSRWPCVALFVLCAGVAGCASVTDPLKTLRQSIGSFNPFGSSSDSSAAATPATPSAKPEPEIPVDAKVQRAYDDARSALERGRVEDAERGFRTLVKSNPELGGPHANLGLILRQAGKLPEAAAEFELAVLANPRQALYFNQLGVTYRQQGQFGKAREAYERAIALDPRYAAAHLNLGILYDLYLSDGKRALERYDSYLALTPGGDPLVTKWIADLKNRKTPPMTVSRKETQ